MKPYYNKTESKISNSHWNYGLSKKPKNVTIRVVKKDKTRKLLACKEDFEKREDYA